MESKKETKATTKLYIDHSDTMAYTKLITNLLLFFALLVVSTLCQSLRKLGQIPAPHAAFAGLVDKLTIEKGSARYTLVVSGFNPIPIFHDTIYEVAGIGEHLETLNSVQVAEVSRDVLWPNEVREVPCKIALLFIYLVIYLSIYLLIESFFVCLFFVPGGYVVRRRAFSFVFFSFRFSMCCPMCFCSLL